MEEVAVAAQDHVKTEIEDEEIGSNGDIEEWGDEPHLVDDPIWSEVGDSWDDFLEDDIACIVAAVYWNYQGTSLGESHKNWIWSKKDLEKDEDNAEFEKSIPGRDDSEEAKNAQHDDCCFEAE